MQSSITVMTLFVVCMLCGCGEPFTSQPASVVAPSQVSPSPKPPSSPAPQGLSGPTGSYTVTLTASPSCEVVTDSVSGQTMPLPDSVRLRRYDAQFADGAGKLTALDGTGNQVSVGGIDHDIYSGQPLMFATGNELTIIVPPSDGGGYIKSTPTCAGGDYWWEVFSNVAGDNQVFERHCQDNGGLLSCRHVPSRRPDQRSTRAIASRRRSSVGACGSTTASA